MSLKLTSLARELRTDLLEDVKKTLSQSVNHTGFLGFLRAAPDSTPLSEYLVVQRRYSSDENPYYVTAHFFTKWLEQKDNSPTIETLLKKLSTCQNLALVSKINRVLATPYSPIKPPRTTPANTTIAPAILQAPAREVLTPEIFHTIIGELIRAPHSVDMIAFCKTSPADTGEEYDRLVIEFEDSASKDQAALSYFESWLERGNPTVDVLLKKIEGIPHLALLSQLKPLLSALPPLPARSPAPKSAPAPQPVPPKPITITTCDDLFTYRPELKQSLIILLANTRGTGGWKSAALEMSFIPNSIDGDKISAWERLKPLEASESFIEYAIEKLWTVDHFKEALEKRGNMKAAQMIEKALNPPNPAMEELTCDTLFRQNPQLKDTIDHRLSDEHGWNAVARKMVQDHPGSISDDTIAHWNRMKPWEAARDFLEYATSKLWTAKLFEEALFKSDHYLVARLMRGAANLPERPESGPLNRLAGDVLTPTQLEEMVTALAQNDPKSNLVAFAEANPFDSVSNYYDKFHTDPRAATMEYLLNWILRKNPTVETVIGKLYDSQHGDLVQKFKPLLLTPPVPAWAREDAPSCGHPLSPASKPAAPLPPLAPAAPAAASSAGKASSNESCAVCAVPIVKKAALIPCGHTYCLGCAKIQETCPTCREPIKSVLRLHEQDFDAL